MNSNMLEELKPLLADIANAIKSTIVVMNKQTDILTVADCCGVQNDLSPFEWVKTSLEGVDTSKVTTKTVGSNNIITIPIQDLILVILQSNFKNEILKATLQKSLTYIAKVTGGEAVLFDCNGDRIASMDSDGNEVKSRLIHSPLAKKAMETMEPILGPSVLNSRHIAVRIPIVPEFGIGFSNYYVAHYEKKKNGLTINNIKGENNVILQCKKDATRMSKNDANVIVYGETGTGKELFVNAIHNESPRGKSPFIAVNCGAIPENLAETIFFGYDGGSFTGSKKEGEKGIFENANGGSLFLDEIGEMSPTMQVKLLRAIQEREIVRVGGNKKIPVNIRIFAATNSDLWSLCERNLFRKDLYYRLSVLELKLPPLRDRLDDIKIIAMQFIKDISNSTKLSCTSITPEALEILKNYNWPGNVRELHNIIERAICMSDGDSISEADLPDKIKAKQLEDETLKNRLSLNEKEALESGLIRFNFDKNAVAKYLNISTTTLWRRMKKYNLESK